MTLPSSGSLTLAQVRAEFGAPVGTPLHALVRGGSYVPNIAANSGVPTAPPITLHQFHGATAYTPISSVTVTPNPASGSTSGVGSGAPQNQTASKTVAVAVTGGNGNNTFSVTQVSGDTLGVTNGNTANPTFSAAPARNQTLTGVYRITVSDGQSSGHQDVTVSLTYNWSSGA